MAAFNKSDADLSLKKYVLGFGLSLVLTLTGYILVQGHLDEGRSWFSEGALLAILTALALTQLAVQARYFLHLSHKPEQRLNLAVFVFAAIIVLTIVFGSLWIMNNLDYHHSMPPAEIDKSIFTDEGIKHTNY